jgi:DNA-binding transcriptional ArsR family regulator
VSPNVKISNDERSLILSLWLDHISKSEARDDGALSGGRGSDGSRGSSLAALMIPNTIGAQRFATVLKSAPMPVYTLTRICAAGYIKRVESVFEIIAEPSRRAILSLLVSSQQSVGEIERQLHMPQPTVSKHLRVLREAGFVESTVDAQRRLYRLKPEPLQEVDAWLAPFRRFWSAHIDALERHLDHMDQIDQPTPTKRKARRR